MDIKTKIMGIKSTYEIDRQTAIQVILSKVVTLENIQLAEILELFPESHFRNYTVLDYIDKDDLDPWEADRIIESIEEF